VRTSRVRAAVERAAADKRTISLRPEAVEAARIALAKDSGISTKTLYESVKAKVAAFNVPGGITKTAEGRAQLANAVAGTTLIVDGSRVSSVAIPGIDDDTILEWAQLEHKWAVDAFSIAMTPAG